MRSMTAFARRSEEKPFGHVSVEVRSVNHRYSETQLKLPLRFRDLEPLIREILRNKIKRGKLECTLQFRETAGVSTELWVNENLVGQLLAVNQAIGKMMGGDTDTTALTSTEILQWPHVIEQKEKKSDDAKIFIMELVEEAIMDLINERAREGKKITELLEARIHAMREILIPIKKWIPEIRAAQCLRVKENLVAAESQLEEDRLDKALVIFAQKMDVDEELDRLHIHLEEVQRCIQSDESVGRRLDFLMQELVREVNTLGSKSQDTRITHSVVELKVLIEQMREQVQNVE
jgi:uncharacterized protein (TIGR00255 family)